MGTVLDQSGASVPNVAITVTNKGTNQSIETKTDEGGRFSVPNLLPGTYDLKAAGSGFRPYNRTNIVITANTIARADIQFELRRDK